MLIKIGINALGIVWRRECDTKVALSADSFKGRKLLKVALSKDSFKGRKLWKVALSIASFRGTVENF
jgi:hypothetical protein